MRKKLYFIFILGIYFWQLNAAHIMGCYLSYSFRYRINNGNSSVYQLQLRVFRDFTNDGTFNQVFSPNDAIVCVYNPDGVLFGSVSLNRYSEKLYTPSSTGCSQYDWVCAAECIYVGEVTLPNNTIGYKLEWKRCCRSIAQNVKHNNGNSYQGFTASCNIPKGEYKNSTPILEYSAIKTICLNDTSIFKLKTHDLDADSISFHFVTPIQGLDMSNSSVVVCDALQIGKTPIDYAIGYSFQNPFGAGGLVILDSVNNNITFFSKQTGLFNFAFEMEEWRNGSLINTTIITETLFIGDLQTLPCKGKFSPLPIIINPVSDLQIRLSQNPTTDYFYIEVNDNIQIRWQLYNAVGQKVNWGSGYVGATIDTRLLPPATYFLKAHAGDKQEIFKLIVL